MQITEETGRIGLFAGAARCLEIADPEGKCTATTRLWQRLRCGALQMDEDTRVLPMGAPGRPATPELVAPGQVPRRRPGSPAGRAALVHAIAHIEFNAINLALDAAYRFRSMPAAFYTDWISVAADEARHYQLLQSRLLELGHKYGDFPAHNGLWEMAERTAESCLERMALVPRVLEARGLDVTPGMIKRLQQAGDEETAGILEVILAGEVRHVEVGTRWFRYCCAEQGVESESTFIKLLSRTFGGSIRGPFNLPARFEAGFTQQEMDAIAGK